MRNLLLTALLLLTACQQSTKQLPPTIPADLTQPCDPLAPFKGSDSDALYTYSLSVIYQYDECSDRQFALSKTVKEVVK